MTTEPENTDVMQEDSSNPITLSEPTFWENYMAPGSIGARVKRMNRDGDPNAYALWSEWCVVGVD